MSEAAWTREAPTKEGWYWWRKRNKKGDVEFCICQEIYLLHRSLYATDCGWVKDLPGEWLGPITPEMCMERSEVR